VAGLEIDIPHSPLIHTFIQHRHPHTEKESLASCGSLFATSHAPPPLPCAATTINFYDSVEDLGAPLPSPPLWPFPFPLLLAHPYLLARVRMVAPPVTRLVPPWWWLGKQRSLHQVFVGHFASDEHRTGTPFPSLFVMCNQIEVPSFLALEL
jgi:hypothetical protein